MAALKLILSFLITQFLLVVFLSTKTHLLGDNPSPLGDAEEAEKILAWGNFVIEILEIIIIAYLSSKW
jgi:large-conductance mechanosensitive channel